MKNPKNNFKLSFTSPHLLSGLKADTPILLALSGGADSRALLEMLHEYCKDSGAQLSLAHVNHMIRGEDALRDRDFCRALAEKYRLPFYLLEADVPALAKEHGRGLEEEARVVRYQFFAKVMTENKIPLLATAHNATDNAETVIFNLARGSGLKGLCGIPPTRSFEGGTVIRPLLEMSKEDILAYCNYKELEYVTDLTNSDVNYSRNRIRNNVIPQLEAINENAISNISRMSDLIRQDSLFLDAEAQSFIDQLEGGAIPTESFNALDGAVASRVAAALMGEHFQVNSVHVGDFLELARRAVPHSRLDLPSSVSATVEDGKIHIVDTPQKQPSPSYDIRIKQGLNLIEELDVAVLADSTENSENEHQRLKNIYKNSTTIYISSDKIVDGLFIRPKNEGDKILCRGMHKKLKKLFCEKKLPLDLRAKLPVFYDSNGILWVPSVALRDGERSRDENFKITLFYN